MNTATDTQIKVPFTNFVDFVVSSGSKRLTMVKEMKYRPDYNPYNDFYRVFRKGIQDIHQEGRSKSSLDYLADQPNASRANTYAAMIKGYKKFWGTKQIEALPLISSRWHHSELSVRLNPELNLLINGEQTIVKLHLRKDERLTKDKVSAIVNLMEEELKPQLPDNVVFGVLDVYQGILHKKDPKKRNLNALIRAEAESLIFLWHLI